MKEKCIVVLSVLVFVSCVSTFTIPKEELLDQIKKDHNKITVSVQNDALVIQDNNGKSLKSTSFLKQEISFLKETKKELVIYNTYKMKDIICYNKKGEKVKLKLDHNSQMKIKLTDNYKMAIYFKPVEVFDNVLIGYKSRILGWGSIANIDSITDINIYAEFPNIQKQ